MRFQCFRWLVASLLSGLMAGWPGGNAWAQVGQARHIVFSSNQNQLPPHVLLGAQPRLLLSFLAQNYSAGDDIPGPIILHFQLDRGTVRDSVIGGLRGSQHTGFASWTLPTLPLGRHTARVWAELPAGYYPSVPADDTAKYVVRVVTAAQTEPRLTLVEDYTSSTCLPCYASGASLYQWSQQAPHNAQAVVVAFQQDYPAPGCYYNNPSSSARAFGPGLPWISVNGRYQAAVVTAPALHLTDELARAALVHLDAAYYRNPVSGELTMWSTIRPLVDFTGVDSDSPKVYVAWVEPAVPAINATNGQTTLHQVSHRLDVARTALLGASGVPVTVPPVRYTPAPADHVQQPATLEAVVWVQISSKANPILQTVRARRLNAPLGEVALTGVTPGWSVAPNPAVDRATLTVTLAHPATVGVRVRDALGRLVRTDQGRLLGAGVQTMPLELAGVVPGVYALEVVVDGQPGMRRLVVE